VSDPHAESLVPGIPDDADDDDTGPIPTENTLTCLNCGHDSHGERCGYKRCSCTDYRPVGFRDLLDPDDPDDVLERLRQLDHVPEAVVQEAKAALEKVRPMTEEAHAAAGAELEPTVPVPIPGEQPLPGIPEQEGRSPALEAAMARVRERAPVVDRELAAMQTIIDALTGLDDEARYRVIAWAWARYG
jgi:hypothetical protein